MPRGRKKLLTEDAVLPIVETENEEGTIPYFLLDDEYGIACDSRCEMLCRKKKSNKTVKDEDGKPHHIETYYQWESFCYVSTFSACIEKYLLIKDRQIKSERLIKTKDYHELINIQNEIRENLKPMFKIEGINKDFISASSILDDKARLREELAQLEEMKQEVVAETEKLMQLIKEKRKIIIDNTTTKEPKSSTMTRARKK